MSQTADAGFQVGVQRSVAATAAQAWELIISRPELWLGEGAALAVRVREAGKTGIHAHLEKLPHAEAREAMRMRWREALERVAAEIPTVATT